MPESDDIRLLKQYADENSESAFAELVTRYVNLVYSAALRSVGHAHAAEEITQAVFIILARKAKSLGDKTVLSGWLYQTARLTAANYLRGEIRRQNREQEAYMQSILNEPESEAWRQISPLLEDAMGRLGERDRNAIVLRFFENKSLGEVGVALGATEDAAKMRVNRALEKLRKFFAKRGGIFSAAAIAGAVSANSVQTAPAGLAAIISATALSGTTITTAAVLAATKAIAMTTLQKTLVTTTLVVTVGAGIFEAHQNSQLREQNQSLQQQQASLAGQIQQLQADNESLSNSITRISDSKTPTDERFNELMKLRGEVGVLRTQNDDLAKLQNENLKLRRDKSILEAEWNNVTNTSQIMHGPYWNRDSWSDIGTTDPLNSLQSLFWALRENNEDKIGELVVTNGLNMNFIHSKGFWNNVKGVHIIGVNYLNYASDQQRVMIDTIIEQTEPNSSDVDSQSRIAQDYLITRQTIHKWFLNQVDGRWQITGIE